jgi:queuine tRNA-ribosyltransferase/7-cyano-7-deazaguanine tRNA-ribosyltransferase
MVTSLISVISTSYEDNLLDYMVTQQHYDLLVRSMMGQMFSFKILANDKSTRLGKLITPHGVIDTPSFVPVGTQASVKSLTAKDLLEIGVSAVLANTYHLHLRPGEEVVEQMGGLHKFMGWGGPIMTDSGGFQVFSLGVAQEEGRKLTKFSNDSLDKHFYRQLAKGGGLKGAKVNEEGVTFYSHLDGTEHQLTPKSSIRIQEALGADLIVCFDDHESPLWSYEETKQSMERGHRWSLESLRVQGRTDQMMYGVTHGGIYEDLRVESARLIDKHFQAVAIGGAYTSKEILYKVIEWSVPNFSTDKPRHLLGIAEIGDLFNGVERGMDLFDCVAATRRARHGSIYISPGNGGGVRNNFVFQVVGAEFRSDPRPLDPGCECYACMNFSRAYINHLFKAKELLAYRLATYHNLYFVISLMRLMRKAIGEKRFESLKKSWIG